MENAGQNDSKDFPFIVMGNKCDRENDRQVSAMSAKDWCEDNNIKHFETSALENTNVDDAFLTMVKKPLDN